MVKKILLDGSPCPKCAQAEELLAKRGYRDRIDEFIVAEEGNPESAGMKLAAERNIDLAPFFVVRDEKGERVYTRVFEFIKKELDSPPGDPSSTNPGSEDFDVLRVAERLSDADPREILRQAQENFGSSLAIAFSGAEDVALIDMASRNGLPFAVFCLDTGRLHPETYGFIDRVREHYGISIEIFSPDPLQLQPFVTEKGFYSFRNDGHGECCGIRKVEPLKRALAPRRAWATGQRRDQSPSTRGDIPVVQFDPAHDGADGHPLVKFNPLAHQSSDAVWAYIRENGVPYNELHDRGFRSIGCAPCTRPSRPGEHERAARWWWEEETKRECGLHVSGKS